MVERFLDPDHGVIKQVRLGPEGQGLGGGGAARVGGHRGEVGDPARDEEDALAARAARGAGGDRRVAAEGQQRREQAASPDLSAEPAPGAAGGAGRRSSVEAGDRAQAAAEAVPRFDQVADLGLDQRAADAAHELLDVVLARLAGPTRDLRSAPTSGRSRARARGWWTSVAIRCTISAISSNCVVELDLLAVDLDEAAAAAGRLVEPEAHERQADVGALLVGERLGRRDLPRGLRWRAGRAEALARAGRRRFGLPDRRRRGAPSARRRQLRDVLDEVERDVAEAYALACAQPDRPLDQPIVVVGAVRRAEVAHASRPSPSSVMLRVVARDRRLEDREALALDLTPDQRRLDRADGGAPRGRSTPPSVGRVAVELDLLRHDPERARELVAALLAQHAHLRGPALDRPDTFTHSCYHHPRSRRPRRVTTPSWSSRHTCAYPASPATGDRVERREPQLSSCGSSDGERARRSGWRRWCVRTPAACRRPRRMPAARCRGTSTFDAVRARADAGPPGRTSRRSSRAAVASSTRDSRGVGKSQTRAPRPARRVGRELSIGRPGRPSARPAAGRAAGEIACAAQAERAPSGRRAARDAGDGRTRPRASNCCGQERCGGARAGVSAAASAEPSSSTRPSATPRRRTTRPALAAVAAG